MDNSFAWKLETICPAIKSGPDLRGPRGPGPQAPHQQRPPPPKVPHQTLHVLFLVQSTDLRIYYLHVCIVDVTHFLPYFNAGFAMTVEYFALFLV